MPISTVETSADEIVTSALGAARRHLGLEVAFVSQLADGRRIFRYVDSALGEDCPVRVGKSDPQEESYCHYVVNGVIPRFLQDPTDDPVAARLEATHATPVGTHLSIPIELSDGRVFGTLCCFSRQVQPSLGPEALTPLQVLTSTIAGYVEELDRRHQDRHQKRRELAGVLERDEITLVHQPIVHLKSGAVAGVESLARFPTLDWSPGQVFELAWDLGLGFDLELHAAELAMAAAQELPGELSFTVNASPSVLASSRFQEIVASWAPKNLVMEVTEHAAVEDHDLLRQALDELAALGVRLAVDDIGTGFSGLTQILRLEPQILKIDAELIGGIDASDGKQALVSALVGYGARRQAHVVAEGVETEEEAMALRVLGVGLGQGFHLGRPQTPTPGRTLPT